MKKLIISLTIGILLLSTFFITITRVFCSELSSKEQLIESWETYKGYFIQADGRVIDFYNNNVSTSEGQSYALLRSVWVNDRETFDTVLNWTNNNLKTRGDNLIGWKWGKNDQGEWKILDNASATDAEQDIALALIMATERWGETRYIDQAKGILKDLWEKEVITIKGMNYLVSGDWAKDDTNVKLNPSYLAPYAYRKFAEVDPDHDWLSLVDSSYKILEDSSSYSVFYLPPDWCYINTETGKIALNPDQYSKENDYSYDAIRVHWRVAFDYILYNEPRAKTYLDKSTDFLINYWSINGSLPSSITANGVIRKGEESFAIYGAVLPAIAIIKPQVANQIYHKKIAADYIKGFWANPKDYYAQNLIWFGVSLWNNIDSRNKPLANRGILHLLEK
jgi:endoglucanase